MLPTDYPSSQTTSQNISQNIIVQAKAGSIAAIIQLLNESLAHLKVRTRAVLEKRSLLLLCEAEKEEALEPEVIVPHVRQVLETIAPSRIRRVHFFSRLTREQQLLWTKEIAHNAQVLWSEEIVLKRPSLLKQWQDHLKAKGKPIVPSVRDLPRRLTSPSHARPVWPTLFGLGLAVLGIVWGMTIAVQRLFFHTVPTPIAAPTTEMVASSDSPVEGTGNTAAGNTNSLGDPLTDPFVEAVRIAEQAVLDGKNATTRTEWLDLAYRWQQASDLMATVQTEDDRYQTAQDRVETYRKNSEAALAKADQL